MPKLLIINQRARVDYFASAAQVNDHGFRNYSWFFVEIIARGNFGVLEGFCDD